MRTRRERRLYLIGLLSLWPPLYMIAFLVVVAIGAANGGDLPVPFGVLFAAHLLTMAVLAFLLFVCIRDAYRSSKVRDDRRTFWAVVLFLGNIVSIPIYWWLYMRPARTDDGSADRIAPPG